MATVSFGAQDAYLTLVFDVRGAPLFSPGPGQDDFLPDQIELSYGHEGQDSAGEDCWRLDEVEIGGSLPGQGRREYRNLKVYFRDAVTVLPQWAYRFAAGVDPAKELSS